MKSAQRKQIIESSKTKKRVLTNILRFVIFGIVILIVFFFLKLNTKVWDGKNKVSFVYQMESGDVGVVVLDPLLMEKTTLIIPANTEVDLARNYGTLSIKNVWQLGVNEKLDGSLLAQTVTKSFLFPTFLWSKNGIDNVLNFVVSPGKTNIRLGDRLQMALFVIRVKSIDSTEINLGKSQYLKKLTLVDGSSGFVQNGPISSRLTVYFSDNVLSTKNLKFGIIDATGKPSITNSVGPILEVMGGKVVSIDRETVDSNTDCNVFGKDKDAVEKVANLFGCKKTSDKSDLDLILSLGQKFTKKF